MAAQPVAAQTGLEDQKSLVDIRASSDNSLGPESTAFKTNPFLDPDVADHYRALYSASQYECRAVFDPLLTWTSEEERRIVRKLDWRVSLWACVAFAALNIDRKNIAQAVSGNMLDDLGLSTDQYNYGNTIFLVRSCWPRCPASWSVRSWARIAGSLRRWCCGVWWRRRRSR